MSESRGYMNERSKFVNERKSYPNGRKRFTNERTTCPNERITCPNERTTCPNEGKRFPSDRERYQTVRFADRAGRIFLLEGCQLGHYQLSWGIFGTSSRTDASQSWGFFVPAAGWMLASIRLL
jgi:hypothetical protein